MEPFEGAPKPYSCYIQAATLLHCLGPPWSLQVYPGHIPLRTIGF